MSHDRDPVDRPGFLGKQIERRTVLKGMGAGTAAVVVARPDRLLAATGTTNPLAVLHTPPALKVDVLRPDDFVRLHFGFVNLQLNAADPVHPVLERVDTTADAMVVVDFGPQHVAEQVVYEGADPLPAASDGVGARLAGASRLAFFLPPDVNTVAYDLETLLDWSTFTPSVVPVAQQASPFALRAAAAIGAPPPIRNPQRNETALELPWWLVLSPGADSAWVHSTQPVTHDGRTELWHTRLASKNGDAVDEARPAPVRAVWARDPDFKLFVKKKATPAGLSDQLATPFSPVEGMPFRMAYAPADRVAAVRNTSDFSAASPLVLNRYTPVPFRTDRLMLSALGAYVDVDGTWNSPFNSLVEWRNRSTLGRDHFVRIVHKGYLHPFGHRCVLVLVSERKFETGSAGRAAYLKLRTFIVVTQPVRSYPASKGLPNEGRELPFHEIEVVTRQSPDFSGVFAVGDPKAMQPHDGSNVPITLTFRGTDWEGNTATFAAPFVFVEDDGSPTAAPFNAAKMQVINAAYSALPAVQRQAALGGQKVAFANPSAPGNTAYPVDQLVFGARDAIDNALDSAYRAVDQLRGFPHMAFGTLKLPDIEKLTGDAGLAHAVRYVEDFVQHEFDDLNNLANKGKAFLKFVDPAILPDPNDPLKDLKSQAMKFANENAGGLVNPNQALSAITRDLGPVAGQLNDIVNNKFDPEKAFEDLSAKILGGIPLKDILALVNDLTNQAEKAINYVKQQLPQELVLSFVWKPALQKDEPLHVFEPSTTDPKATAVLQGEFRQSLTDPNKRSAKFDGEITNFKLNLIGDGATLFLVIDIAKFGFKSGSGQKTDVELKINRVTFAGVLSFVEEFREILENLGQQFGVKQEKGAITAKLNLEVPTIAVGVFTCSHLAFNAGLTVPLDGTPVRVRFGFSTRDNPFVLTVSCFGGGGWFAIALGADGVESLEIGFEAAAQLALDVGVAAGSVEAALGIYFKIAKNKLGNDDCTLEGFLKLHGHVSVLGIVSVDIEIYLSFQFLHKGGPPELNILTGKAKATLKVSILFFSISVSVEVEKSLGGDPNDPTFAQAISASDWSEYADAFATVA